MAKERVLIFDDHSERSTLLSSSLIDLGYDVVLFDCGSEIEMQNKIHIYNPDYLVTDTDELVALRKH